MYLPSKLQKSPLHKDTYPSEHFPSSMSHVSPRHLCTYLASYRRLICTPVILPVRKFPVIKIARLSPTPVYLPNKRHKSPLYPHTAIGTFPVMNVTRLSLTLVYLPNKLHTSPLHPDTQVSERSPSLMSHLSPRHLCTYLASYRRRLCMKIHTRRNIFRYQSHTSLPDTCVPI